MCYTYTPNAGFIGRDSFAIIACDGGTPDLCDTAWVQVNVVPVNDPPVAVLDAFSLLQTDSLDFNLDPSVKVSTNDTDIDDAANTLIYSILQTPTAAQGVLNFNSNGSFKFVPNPNFSSVLKLPYRVCDPQGACDVDTLQITVIDVNAPPLAVDDYVVVHRNNFADLTVLANDTDDNGLNPASVVLTKNGSKGVAVANPVTGQIRYTPNLNAFGYDTIKYRVCDLGTPPLCDTATVYIEITTNFINQPPVLNRDSITVLESSTNNVITVLNNDSDPDGGINNATLAIQRLPLNGTAVADPVTGVVRYTPNPSFAGVDSFKYRVCDNGLPTPICDSQTVVVTVLPVNDAPIAINDTVSTNENQTLNGSVATNDNDIDLPANTLTYNKLSDPSAVSGTWTLQPNGNFQFIPTAGFIGLDSMQYRVCDDSVPSLCDTAWVFVTVNNVNDTPSVSLPPPVLNEDDSLTVCSTVQDPEAADSHTVTFCKIPSFGTATRTFNNTTKELCFTYKPNLNYQGKDSICFETCDNGTPVICKKDTVVLTINPSPDTPSVIIPPIVVPMDSTMQVCGTIADIDTGQTFVASICQAPAHGSATPSVSGSQICFQYTPAAGYLGPDTVCVRVCDNDGLCREVRVPISVTACPIMVDSVVVINASCPSLRDGRIKIYAKVNGGTLEYSIWNGQEWSSQTEYSRLRAGAYRIKVRRVGGGCEVNYGIVQITAPVNCTEICNDNIDNDGDGLIDVADELDCKPKAIIAPRGN